jgi:hypothetical protein
VTSLSTSLSSSLPPSTISASIVIKSVSLNYNEDNDNEVSCCCEGKNDFSVWLWESGHAHYSFITVITSCWHFCVWSNNIVTFILECMRFSFCRIHRLVSVKRVVGWTCPDFHYFIIWVFGWSCSDNLWGVSFPAFIESAGDQSPYIGCVSHLQYNFERRRARDTCLLIKNCSHRDTRTVLNGLTFEKERDAPSVVLLSTGDPFLSTRGRNIWH